jgi:DNA-binding NarL/FixJ family response regulator
MRALLIDDHLMFSQSLRFLLEDLDPGLTCESASTIADAVARPGPFDFILLDYSLPDSQGTSGLKRVLHAHDEATVVMLSGDVRAGLVHELVEAGAAGFVPKSSDMDTLLLALRTMLAGGVYLPPYALNGANGQTTAPLVPSRRATDKPAEMAPPLSPRQLECLLKLVQGKPNKAIARELDLGDSTVKTHLASAFKALGVNNRAEAVFKAAALGLLPPPSSPPGVDVAA